MVVWETGKIRPFKKERDFWVFFKAPLFLGKQVVWSRHFFFIQKKKKKN